MGEFVVNIDKGSLHVYVSKAYHLYATSGAPEFTPVFRGIRVT